MKPKKAKSDTQAFEKASLQSLDGKEHYELNLFVTGLTPRSRRSIENVRRLCEKHLKGRYTLKIIDIYQSPESAKLNQIIASPTLIKKLPNPLRRFVGDMTKTDRILAGLNIKLKEKP